MVLPLTYYYKDESHRDSTGTIVSQTITSGYRQRRPYTIPTNVDRGSGKSKGTSVFILGPDSSSFPRDLRTEVENRAYDKMIGKLGDSSSFGATLTAERKETWSTVVMLLTRAAESARMVAAGRLLEAARLLGVPYREVSERVKLRKKSRGRGRKVRYVRRRYIALPNGRLVTKTAANGWLLWSYGVKPLAEDIYNGMDVLQRPLHSYEPLRAGARGSRNSVYNDPGVSEILSTEYSVRWSAVVTVDNPNLWLMNRMGLVNPATWVLEGIPFSFVVDWFSNLSSVISAFTDFTGLRVESSYVTRLVKHSRTTVYPRWNPPGVISTESTHFSRRGGGLSPKLRFAYERFQWQRGLNAISLLVGFLPRR